MSRRPGPRIERTRATGGDEKDPTSGDGEASEEEEEEVNTSTGGPSTSLEDLTTEADPTTFDQSFTTGDTNLTIQGDFDPVAGAKQVIPRIAFVINYNMVYNEERERWEPKKSELEGEDEEALFGGADASGVNNQVKITLVLGDATPQVGTELSPNLTLSTSVS